MAYTILILILVLGAILAALLVIGFALFIVLRNRKGAGNPAKRELTQQEADEVVSTWNLLNH